MFRWREDQFNGRLGVVVRKGVIVDNSRASYEVRLIDNLDDEPEVVYVVTESLYFFGEEANRRI